MLLIVLLLLFQDALPPVEMNPAEENCGMADVVLCLGTRCVSLIYVCAAPLLSSLKL